MKRFTIAVTLLAFTAGLGIALQAAAHCQIPCGIFDDELQVRFMEQDITTIEKSMQQIVALGAATPVDSNQLVRWVMNKEEHAQKLQDSVTAYFMAQRIKPPADHGDEAATKDYVNKLTLLHAIQIHAMKAKQSTNLDEIATLRQLVTEFRKAYFGEEAEHAH